VVIYTIFHYVAFAIIGIIAAMVVHQARRTPAILAGFLIAFVVFEIGFYGLAALLSVSTALGGLAWYQIGVANLVAAVVMFYFMWARHPELKRNFTTALEGRDV
jgi:peptidoglycan/LPS O-acetylase OafA/YrhL